MNEHQPQKKKEKSFLSKYSIWMLAAVILAIVYLGIQQTKNEWTTQDKVSLCKAYIADQFAKPLNIMQLQRVDNKGLVYISYTRVSDNTKWDYVCEINDSSILWAGWVDGNWGRWRHEDQVSINYNPQTKTASFDSIMSSESIKVKL
jgi:hypothetical protein